MNNKEYWKEREKERLELIDISVNDRIKDVEGVMNSVVNKIEHEIFKLYEKYAIDNELSYQDTLFYLNDNELKEFQKDLKYYVETFRDSSKAKVFKSELQALSTRARVKRLEALKANIKIQATELEKLLADDMPGTFNTIYDDSYFYNLYSQCLYTNNLGVRFDIPSPNILKELLSNPWSGKNYSDKVWNVTNNFNSKLDSVITTGLIRGEHPNIIAKNLRDAALGKRNKYGKFKGGSLYDCKRLVRTEAAFIAEQATKKSYDDNNVKEYEYLATLDLRTSLICQELDGKTFKVKDIITGVNYPPMHCFCRSTTIPVIKWDGEDNTPYERIARDPITGTNNYINDMDYSDWKDKQYAKYGEYKINSEEKKIRNKASDRKQHVRYRKELGNITPKSFTEFQDLKYNNKEAWDRLKYNYKLETVYNLNRLKYTENFASKDAIKHILEGEINRRGRAVGFHMENIPTRKGKVIESTRSIKDKNGVYSAKVEVNGILKDAKSSFFPTNMIPQQIVNAINEAYENREPHFIRNMMKGKTSYGFEIGMYLDRNGKISTAFPLKEE
ncbi:minor capsid protein [Clostridium perfringens]|uniref:minor capsid protein n=1 Tax=Clostridium perfringens TaxID=1502 RepID=UPI0030D24493